MRRHVYFYTPIDREFDEAAERLRAGPGTWLPAPADPDPDGATWVVQLSADGALPASLSSLPARVDIGAAEDFDGRVLRSVRWRGRSAERLFPVLEADLDLQRLDGTGCWLALTGTYRPPLSAVGGMGDRMLGHRVAEACVRRFVLDVADRLAARVGFGE